MSLYSQQVSNNPLTLDGLLTGNFDLLYVDGALYVPTNTAGLVPYTNATTSVNLNSQKITTTYMAVNAEDLTNKDFTDGTYLAKSGFSVSSGNFQFNPTSGVYLYGDTYIGASSGTVANLLAINSSGKLITTNAVGDALLAGGTIAFPQNFTGYNSFQNILKCLSGINFPYGLPAGTAVATLGITSTGDICPASAVGDALLAGGSFASPQNFTGYNSFIGLTSTGTIISNNLRLTTLSSGTQVGLLAYDSAGNVIIGSSTGAPTQINATLINSGTLYPAFFNTSAGGVQTVYVENGGDLRYAPATNTLTSVNFAGSLTGNADSATLININASSPNASWYPIFTSVNTGGNQQARTETGGNVYYNPNTNIFTTGKLQITTVPTGTQTYLLAVDSAGNVIQGTVTAGDAVLANTQTFTGINTFSNQMTLTKGFDLTLGAVNSFSVRNSSLVTQFTVQNTGVTMGNLVLTGTIFNMSSTSPNFIYSGDSLAISASTNITKTIIMSVAGTGLTLDQYGASLSSDTKILYCNNYEGLSFLGINMVGYQDSFFKIGNTVNISSQPVGWDFQTKFGSFPNYTTHARISGSGVGTNALYSFASNNLNITCASTINYGATTAHSFSVNSVGNFAVSGDGLWMPVDASKSFYITDNYPRNATSTYGRYFGLNGIIYQDYYNQFQWRRSPNIDGSAVATLMSLDSNGLTLQNAVGAGHPQIVFAGSGTPLIKCTGVGLNWFVNSGDQLGFFDLHAGHWRIGTAGGKKLILCAGTANTLQIGTGTSGQYPVEIYGYQVITGAYWYYLGGANWVATGTLTIAVGLYVQYAISADGGYILASDERIKKNIKPAESGSLAVIKTIPIKSYEHIDPFVHGCATAFNVTAQDLKNTYPEAVTNSSGYIPDMYVKCRWIHVDEKQIEINIPKPHTVIVGDKVKLILEDSTHREAVVTAIKNDNTFAVEKWEEFKLEVSDEMFVYGKHTDDFLRVDKIKLGVLALAGVKELNQIVETQHLQIQAQQAKIDTQQQTIETLTGHLAKLTEQVNLLTKILSPV